MGPNQPGSDNWVHLGNWPTPVERPPWIFLVYGKSLLWSIPHRWCVRNSKIPKCPCHFFRLEYQMWTKVYHSFLFILLLFPHLWCFIYLFIFFQIFGVGQRLQTRASPARRAHAWPHVRQQPNVGLIPIIPLSSIRGCPMERGRWILFYFILSTSKISENGWKSCRWMKQHVNPALNEWKLIALYMYRWNTQEKKGVRERLQEEDQSESQRTSELHVICSVTGQRSWNISRVANALRLFR